MRILYVSSSHSPWYAKGTRAEEHLKCAPYSIDAIGYNLEKMGWTVAWLGWKDTANPYHLAKEIDEFKPDIIYTYGGIVGLNPLFCRRFLCRHKAFKVVHGWDDEYGFIARNILPWPVNIAASIFLNFMEKRIVRNSDAVVTLSYYLQQKGSKWGVKCHYIPNGADPVSNVRIGGSIKLMGRFNVVYCGDKAKWKRTYDVCRSMRALPKDLKLYLTGRDYDYLRRYASENCIFLGYLSKEEQFNVMSQADAFVVTADQDCNAKLQEYLRWKKPILAYDGRANLFFRNGRNALLAKDGDYAPLIEKLASDPVLCRKLAENAAVDIPLFSWVEVAKIFADYFIGLIQKQ